MEAVIITFAVAIANIACFIIGVKTGMAVAKDEPIVVPTQRAFDYTKSDASKEAEIAKQKIDTILRNIERYDGTGMGQEEV